MYRWRNRKRCSLVSHATFSKCVFLKGKFLESNKYFGLKFRLEVWKKKKLKTRVFPEFTPICWGMCILNSQLSNLGVFSCTFCPHRCVHNLFWSINRVVLCNVYLIYFNPMYKNIKKSRVAHALSLKMTI